MRGRGWFVLPEFTRHSRARGNLPTPEFRPRRSPAARGGRQSGGRGSGGDGSAVPGGQNFWGQMFAFCSFVCYPAALCNHSEETTRRRANRFAGRERCEPAPGLSGPVFRMPVFWMPGFRRRAFREDALRVHGVELRILAFRTSEPPPFRVHGVELRILAFRIFRFPKSVSLPFGCMGLFYVFLFSVFCRFVPPVCCQLLSVRRPCVFGAHSAPYGLHDAAVRV